MSEHIKVGVASVSGSTWMKVWPLTQHTEGGVASIRISTLKEVWPLCLSAH